MNDSNAVGRGLRNMGAIALMTSAVAFAAAAQDPLRAGFAQTAIAISREELLAGHLNHAQGTLLTPLRAVSDEHEDLLSQARLSLAQTKVLYYKRWIKESPGETEEKSARSVLATALADGDEALVADARDHLALVLFGRNFRVSEHAESRELLEKALAVRRKLGDRCGVSESLFHLGLTYEHVIEPTPDDVRRAGEIYRESLAAAKAGGCDYEASYAERHLAGQADDAGHLEAAIEGFERSLELRRRSGATLVLAPALTALADAVAKSGDVERARELYEEAIEVAESIEATRFIEEPAAGLARLK